MPRPPRRCRLSGECSHPDACILTLCTNPCLTNNPCDITAECKPYNRTAYCACPRGWFGDPFEECILHPLLRRIFTPFLIDDFVLLIGGKNIIAAIKMRNNYGAIQSFKFPILRQWGATEKVQYCYRYILKINIFKRYQKLFCILMVAIIFSPTVSW